MSLEIRWSAPALLSLAEVLEYTATMFGEKQAEKIRTKVIDAVKRLSFSPNIASVEPCSEQVGVELRGFTVIKQIKIIYSVSDTTINIEYIKNTYLSDKTMLERMYFSDL